MRVKVEIPRIEDRNARENAILRQGVSIAARSKKKKMYIL